MTRTLALADLIRPGASVAVADGMGAPRAVSAELSAIARQVGDVRLVLGWLPTPDDALDVTAFADVRVLMGGWGMRGPIKDGTVTQVPCRWSQAPVLMESTLRPDVVVASVVEGRRGGWMLGAAVGWVPAALRAGATLAAVVTPELPRASAAALPASAVAVVGHDDATPPVLEFPEPEAVHRRLGEHVASLVPEGARLQVGPGALGTAVLDAVRAPVRIDSGLLPAAVVDLDRRGLLLGNPMGTYLAGDAELLAWAHDRPLLHPIDFTHDGTRLVSSGPFVAVNTALEIDDQGQVNVEGPRDRPIASPGGHPDYAAAAARSPQGLSVIAVPSTHRGRPTLVDQLSGPVSTPGYDVDVVVTENGIAHLRGLGRDERARTLRALWER